jgi:hypothetical protein
MWVYIACDCGIVVLDYCPVYMYMFLVFIEKIITNKEFYLHLSYANM